MSTAVTHYNLLARIFHWLSAVIIFAMFGLGLWMVDLNYYSEWYKLGPYWHKSIGILLAAFTLLRIIWKVISRAPKTTGKPYEVVAAHAVHWLMYLLLALLFCSGYLISTSDSRGIAVFNWFELPSLGALFAQQSDIAGLIHYYSALVLMGFAGLHLAAALKHHFINHDNTLKKMIGK